MTARNVPIISLMLLLGASLSAQPSRFAQMQKLSEPGQGRAANHVSEAEALHQQAMQLIDAGQYGLAHTRLFEAVRLWKQAQQSERAIQVLLQLAEADRKAQRWQAALQCYRQVLQFSALPDQVKASAFNSVGRLYTQLQQLHLAEEYYQDALRLARRLKDPQVETAVLIGLAEVSAEQGKVGEARTYLEQARPLAQQNKDKRAVAATLSLLGRTYRAQGQISTAHTAIEEALGIQRQSNAPEDETLSQCLLSDLDLHSGQLQAAFAGATEAVKLANLLRVSELQWRAYLALARAQRALGRGEESVKSYYRALSFIEMQRLLYSSADAFKITLLAERQAPYRELADLLLEPGRVEEAFGIIQFARSRATLDLLAQTRRRPETSRAVESNDKLRELEQRIARLRAELRSAPLDDRQQAARQTELAEAEQRQTEARWAAEMERLNHFVQPITIKATQKLMRQARETLLEFSLGEKRSYVWLISAEEVRWAVLPGQQEIEEKVRPYLEMIGTKPRRLSLEQELATQKKLGEQLFTLLIGPLAERLTIGQRLTIAPDGLLYYLPFETLIRNGDYLLGQYQIHYIPSASVLNLLPRSGERVDSQAQMELLAFGDPVFVPPQRTTGRRIPPAGQPFWSSSSLRLPPLPNTRVEVLSISEPFQPERIHRYLGREATEEAFKRAPLDRYRRIHFATHSLIDEQVPARSGVALTLADKPQEDGWLEVDEISELRLDCELVVLSACRTWRGQLVRGEGIVGLTRAFLYAGARSVAASLWNVSDLSTTRLMQSFYRHLAAGSSPAAALRQAKLE